MKNRTKKIFVGGVPTDMPEEVIRNYFINFGDVSAVCVCVCVYACVRHSPPAGDCRLRKLHSSLIQEHVPGEGLFS